jgi:hypothetical protein
MWPFKSQTHNGTCPGGWEIGNYTLGFECSTITVNGVPYLTRYFLRVGGFTLRLHKFYKGDDDRAPHTHPWTFWTFPLCRGYWELVPCPYGSLSTNWVPGWRISRRPAEYQHIVIDPPKPFWTVVVTGRKSNSWGFYPTPDMFVPWREWK